MTSIDFYKQFKKMLHSGKELSVTIGERNKKIVITCGQDKIIYHNTKRMIKHMVSLINRR